MKLKSQKGFTLVELLAVIVVLAILMLVAGTSVIGAIDDARKGTFRTEFLGLLDSAKLRANLDMMDSKLTVKKPKECISIADLKEFDNVNKYRGSVCIYLKADHTLEITGWMANDTYMIQKKTTAVTREEVEAYGSAADATTFTTCNNECK